MGEWNVNGGRILDSIGGIGSCNDNAQVVYLLYWIYVETTSKTGTTGYSLCIGYNGKLEMALVVIGEGKVYIT